MRSIYSKYLKTVLGARLAAMDPPFSPNPVKSKLLLPQEIVYASDRGSASLYVILLIHPKNRQAFTFEYGWSTTGRFPEVLPVKCPGLSEERTEFATPELLQRISRLTRKDIWWWLEDPGNLMAQFRPTQMTEEQARGVVDRTAAEAFAWLEAFLFPYLREYADYIKDRASRQTP